MYNLLDFEPVNEGIYKSRVKLQYYNLTFKSPDAPHVEKCKE